MNWRDIGDTTLAAFRTALKGTPLEPEADAIYGIARPHTKLLIAQATVESRLARDQLPASHNFLGQRPRGGDGFKDFDSFAECASYWHDKIVDPDYTYAETVTLEQYIHVYAPASDGNDEANYVASIERTVADLPNQSSGGGSPVPLYYTDIPGLPGGPLLTTHPIQIKIIPEWRTNNRPGIAARTPRRSVQHGNGNPNSSAAGEATYLFNGAEGRQASYHSTTDDKESWIMVPADEVTWQAADGSGPGNMNGFSNEMVEDAGLWANPTRRDRVIANAAELMGGVAARLGIQDPEQHWTFNYALPPSQRHDCPNKLRYTRINGRLAWDIYADKWRAAKAAELDRMNGEEPAPIPTPTPIPTPIYAAAITSWMGDDLKKGTPSDHSFTTKVDGDEVKVKLWGAEREYECLKSTPRYQGPDVKGKKVGGNLTVREEFVGSYFATVGKTRWVVTKYGSWIRADALNPRVSVRAA